MSSSKGIIYCARGNIYYRRALLSMKSIHRNNPELSCSICTTKKLSTTTWDKVIPLPYDQPPTEQYMRDKLFTLLNSPYDWTLYLDSDTYILADLNPLFSLLEKFDLAIAHGHDRQKRFDIQTGKAPYEGLFKYAINPFIPISFSPVQGGVILYRKNSAVTKWLKTLNKTYKQKKFYDDQVSMRELLWDTNLRFYMLPPEYNFNSIDQLKAWRKNNFQEAKPAIFHYTKHKSQNIQTLVDSVFDPKKSDWQKLDQKLYKIKEKLQIKIRKIICVFFK